MRKENWHEKWVALNAMPLLEFHPVDRIPPKRRVEVLRGGISYALALNYFICQRTEEDDTRHLLPISKSRAERLVEYNPEAVWVARRNVDLPSGETQHAQIMTDMDMFQTYCRVTCQWGLHLVYHFPGGDDRHNIEELRKAVPYIDDEEKLFQLLAYGHCHVFHPEQAYIEDLYERTVGDDGPTEKNSYDGPVRVYALTCSNEGVTINENT